MNQVEVFIVDAFTDDPLRGNPAGLVPNAAHLSAAQMQAIAGELGASETAFLRASASADQEIRFFSPTQEVDLCGHATIAAYSHLYREGAVAVGDHALETSAGEVAVSVNEDGLIWMTQPEPEVEVVDVSPTRVGEAIGIDPTVLNVDGLPIARASTGLPILVVPVQLLEHLGSIDPDSGAVQSLTTELETKGLYVFTFDTLEASSNLHGRAFYPGLGIPEDPVTGTASGAVGGYLRHVGAFDSMPDVLVFEQGDFIDRGGRVFVRVGGSIEVGGYGSTALDGEIVVPPMGEDEIVEI